MKPETVKTVVARLCRLTPRGLPPGLSAALDYSTAWLAEGAVLDRAIELLACAAVPSDAAILSVNGKGPWDTDEFTGWARRIAREATTGIPDAEVASLLSALEAEIVALTEGGLGLRYGFVRE